MLLLLACSDIRAKNIQDIKRSLKGENIELLIENFWNRQTLAEKNREYFLVLRLFDTRHNLSFHKGNLIFEHSQRRSLRTELRPSSIGLSVFI